MSSLKELARLLAELEGRLASCMRCGLCQAVCPLFAETGREADVARGKLALLSGLAQEILKNPQGGPGSSEPLPVMRLLRRQLSYGFRDHECFKLNIPNLHETRHALAQNNLLDGFAQFMLYKGILPGREQTDRKDLRWGKARQGVRIKQVPLPHVKCSRLYAHHLFKRRIK